MLLLVYTPDFEGDPLRVGLKTHSKVPYVCSVPIIAPGLLMGGLSLPSLFPSLFPVSSTNTLFTKSA